MFWMSIWQSCAGKLELFNSHFIQTQDCRLDGYAQEDHQTTSKTPTKTRHCALLPQPKARRRSRWCSCTYMHTYMYPSTKYCVHACQSCVTTKTTELFWYDAWHVCQHFVCFLLYWWWCVFANVNFSTRARYGGLLLATQRVPFVWNCSLTWMHR